MRGENWVSEDKSTNTVDANEALNKLKKSGFIKGLQRDWNAVKKAGVRTAESFGDGYQKKTAQETVEHSKFLEESGMPDEQIAFKKASREEAMSLGKKERSLEKIGGNLLEDLGRGNKIAGGAKLGAYMVGASMLTDLLNPFND